MRSSNHYGLGLKQLSAMETSFGGGGGRFNESFECNQSFPRALRNKQPQADLSDITHLRGCELSSVSFLKQTLVNKTKLNASNQRRAILLNDSSNFNTSRGANLDKSWMFYNKMMMNQTSPNNQQSLYLNNTDTDLVTVQQNPNKALITINGRTTEILTANNISCDLFGYSETDLLGKKLKDLLIEPDENQDDGDNPNKTKKALIETGKLDQNGRVVICSGRIMEAISASETKTQQNMPVSIYMMKLTDEAEPKCLCVMEPIQRVSGSFGINFKGRICYSSPSFSQIFGYTVSSSHSHTPRGPSSLANLSSSTLLNGRDINDLLPAMKLPINGITSDLKRQLLTGRSLQGENIPVTVSILNKSLLNNEIVFNCHVAVYTNMSGLVVVRASDYKISSYNATFARFIFGYDDKDLINKPVEYLIPNFFEPDTEIMASRSAIQTSARRVSSSFYNLTRSGSRHHGSRLLLTNSSKRQSLNTTNGSKLKSLGQVPTFRITDHDDEEEDKLDTASINSTTRSATNTRSKFSQIVCAQCGKRFIKQMASKKRSLDEDEETSGCKRRGSSDLLEEINLMDNTEYSPNKKCVNYINANSFTPTRGSGSATMPTTPQSTVKKSLLAKAITKNATNAILNRDSFNFDDNSKLNNSSMMVDYSFSGSPTSSPSKMSTSTMGGSQDMDQQSSVSSYVSDRASTISDFSSCGDLLQETAICEECKTNKYHDDQDEKSEVSLIMDQTNEIEMSEDVKSTTATTTKDVEEVEEEEAPAVVKFKNITSTPYRPVPQHDNQIDDGLFFGKARHADSSQVKIFYQRKWMESGDLIYVWISRDPYSDMSMMDSLDQSNVRSALLNASQQDSILGSSVVDAYSKEYENIHTLGCGVSGFVKLARRRVNNFPVVTKYIQKEKVYQENYVEDKRYGCVPLEISLLCKLEHKNIIRVLDVFQTNSYIQMVMEKHGCGMDLFEFIDRVQHKRPINEGLISHIFKQLVSAVSYLHSNQIVHRDIKDENIVIDERFDIKLIDFGSAAYMSPDKKFGTFCGTMEYCSPEILLGNKYHGPELDVWTCGIVLYTLAFCENPFNSTEETIECVLKPPLKVSKELMKLLFAILCPDPELRARIDQIERNEWVNQSVDMQAFKWEEVVDNTEFQTNDAGVEGQEDAENNNKENRVILNNRDMLSKSF